MVLTRGIAERCLVAWPGWLELVDGACPGRRRARSVSEGKLSPADGRSRPGQDEQAERSQLPPVGRENGMA